jgi:hypothetical protein
VLFRAKIPSANLPWVFLAIAGLSLASVKLNARATRAWSGLLATLVLAHFWDLIGARFTIRQSQALRGRLKLSDKPTTREIYLAIAALGGHLKHNGGPG